MEAVKVAVRVRPFNSREIEEKAKLCVNMVGAMTEVKNFETGIPKKFTFDYSYWSHDKDEEHTFADQAMVFKDLGSFYLENAWAGYNCTLFAYGQTGSGKSYSMTGYGDARGIIPLGCEELFNRLDKDKDNKKVKWKVEVSYLEIYNERIRDLLNPSEQKLDIHENPAMGVYVKGQSWHLVHNYQEIEYLMDAGQKSRSVAATKMNATSSRSHCVVMVMLTKLTESGETKAKVNLVDLAGSERQEKTGATGDRLKEACAINKSLTCLGNVIKALADNASLKKGQKKKFVPFRDSALTWLLKESLGGNSKTIMIAAISPAHTNFDETVSTLRYADRAKNIKCAAVRNENPTTRLINDLKSQVDELRKQLENKDASMKKQGIKVGSGDRESQLEEEERKRIMAELEESERLQKEMAKSWDQREKETKDLAELRNAAMEDMGLSVTELGSVLKVDMKKAAQLINLAEDPMMSECLVYFIQEGKSYIGNPTGRGENLVDPKDKKTIVIKLPGRNIHKSHCKLDKKGDDCYISPCGDAKTFVNGKQISEPTLLSQGDRIAVGTNQFFRYHHPRLAEKARKEREARNEDASSSATFEDCIRELASEQGISSKEDQMKKVALSWQLAGKKAQLKKEQQASERLQKDATEKEQALKEAEEQAESRKDEMEKRLKDLNNLRVSAKTGGDDANTKEEMNKMEQQVAQLKAQVEVAETARSEALAKVEQEQGAAADPGMVSNAMRNNLTTLVLNVNKANDIAADMEKKASYTINVKVIAGAQVLHVTISYPDGREETVPDESFMTHLDKLSSCYDGFCEWREDNPNSQSSEYIIPGVANDPFSDASKREEVGSVELPCSLGWLGRKQHIELPVLAEDDSQVGNIDVRILTKKKWAGGKSSGTIGAEEALDEMGTVQLLLIIEQVELEQQLAGEFDEVIVQYEVMDSVYVTEKAHKIFKGMQKKKKAQERKGGTLWWLDHQVSFDMEMSEVEWQDFLEEGKINFEVIVQKIGRTAALSKCNCSSRVEELEVALKDHKRTIQMLERDKAAMVADITKLKKNLADSNAALASSQQAAAAAAAKGPAKPQKSSTCTVM